MSRYLFRLGIVAVTVALASGAPASAEHRLGLGLHYWRTIDDLDDEGFGNLEDRGGAWVLSYQWVPSALLRLEVDLECFDKGFGGAEGSAYSPIAFALIGAGPLYGGLGIGVTVASDLDGDFSDPFYAARVGTDIVLLPRLYLDVNANYRFDAWNELEGVDTGTVTLGASLRVAF